MFQRQRLNRAKKNKSFEEVCDLLVVTDNKLYEPRLHRPMQATTCTGKGPAQADLSVESKCRKKAIVAKLNYGTRQK